MEPSTPAPADTDPTRDVFSSGPALLGADELAAITRSLSELILPLAAAWTELLGQDVEVGIGAVRSGPTPRPPDAEPDPSATILDGIGDAHAFRAIGAFGGELGTIALVVPTPLGLVVVDVLLGGTGRPSGERSLSAIDFDLLTTIAGPTFAALRRLGNPDRVDEPVPVLTGLEEPELTVRLASGTLVDLMITVGEHSQPLILVFGGPGARHLAGAALTLPTEAPAEQSRALLEGVLADVVVEAIVSFPSVLVPSHQILALDVGDVIGLGTDPDEPLPLRVDGHHLADVRPARAGADVACQIVSTAIRNAGGTHPFPSRAGSSASGGLL